RHRAPDGIEGVGGQFLRYQADQRARRTIGADDVVTGGGAAARAGLDDVADDADQRRLARAVGTQQREDLAAAYLEVDVLERLETGSKGLGESGDRDDGGHGESRGRA